MSQKTLTISIAAYNVETFIEKALCSCLANNEINDLEILVINDGSEDNTSYVAHKYEKQYPNIIRVIDKDNGGYGSTVNVSIQQAQGKYFKLLDADDRYNTQNLNRLLIALRKIDVDMVITDYCYINNDGKIIDNISFSISQKEKIKLKDVDYDTNITMPAICYKTEILKSNNIKLQEKILYTDTEFVLYPMPYVNSLYYLPIPIYLYLVGYEGQSVSGNVLAKHSADALKICDALLAYYSEHKGNINSKKIMQGVVAQSAKFYLFSLLLMRYSSKTKEIIKAFDCGMRKKDIVIYNMMSTKLIILLRKSNYKVYGVCSLYKKYIEKLIKRQN